MEAPCKRDEFSRDKKRRALWDNYVYVTIFFTCKNSRRGGSTKYSGRKICELEIRRVAHVALVITDNWSCSANPLRVLFVIRECEVLSRRRINGESPREWKRRERGGPSERLPVRSDPMNERQRESRRREKERKGETRIEWEREPESAICSRSHLSPRLPHCTPFVLSHHLARLLRERERDSTSLSSSHYIHPLLPRLPPLGR